MDAGEKCGLFGAFGLEKASECVYHGLFALQHRGQESAGIVSSAGGRLLGHKGMGLVGEVFDEAAVERLAGTSAIGHVRYSTTGSSNVSNAQPFQVKYSGGEIAVAHNGNLTNAAKLRRDFEGEGSIFQTTMDTEIILHILAKLHRGNGHNLVEKALARVEGAYCLLFLAADEMIAARDPHGFRPLALGRLGDAWMVASETCAFDIIGAEFVREIEPGEIVHISDRGVRSEWVVPKGSVTPKHCIFEHIYFSRPDSVIFGDSVHQVRKRLGERLAKDSPVDADIVVAIPEGGRSAAIGYSEVSGIPIDRGFIVNRYVGRTFIKPDQRDRLASVKAKLNVVKDVVRGKRVVVVDDSVVRGTTCRAKMAILREAGAREVHFRVTCAPHRYGCYYGIDFPKREELLAVRHSADEIREFLKVDSIAYQTVEGMLSCVSNPSDQYCHACFTGKYPVLPDGDTDKFILERA